jgi:hypothetical protein
MGGTCTTVTLLALDADYPTAIAVHGDYVYWTAIGPGSYQKNGTVKRVDTTGANLETIANSQWYPVALAVDDTGVYWTTMYENPVFVHMVPLSGGPVAGLPTGEDSAIWPIQLDSAYVYWTGGWPKKTVMRMPKQGGTPEGLPGITDPRHFAVDNGDVFWIRGDGLGDFEDLMRTAVPSGETKELLSDVYRPSVPRLDGVYVYLAGGVAEDIIRLPRNGGAMSVIVPGAQVILQYPMAVDAANIYWIGNHFGGYTITRAPKAGGQAIVMASSLASPATDAFRFLVADDKSVYWIRSSPAPAAIMKMAK